MENTETLALRATNGDKTAFEQLYTLTYKSVYFTCISFLKNEADAKDATSETYLTALEKLNSLEDKSKFSAWINRIAVNKCRDFLKKKTPEPLDDEQLENLLVEDDENFLPEDYLTDREKRKIVMDIIQKVLSQVQYQTVIMFYFDEMSVAEIAEIMNCPVGTVTYRLSVARSKIKEGVLNYEDENDDRLHGIVGIPFLTRLFKAEAESLEIPPFPSNISSVKNPVNNAKKGVAKGMFNTLKAKIIAGAVAVAVVGGGVTAGVILSNNGDTDDNEASVSKNVTTENADKTQSESSTVSESSVLENYSGTRLFIDDIDLSTPISDGSGLQISDRIGGTLDLPITAEQFDEKYTFTFYWGGENVYDTIEDALYQNLEYASTDEMPLHCQSKNDSEDGAYEIDVQNPFDDNDITFQDCFEGNLWLISQTYTPESILDPEGTVDEDDDKALIENFIDKVGSPNYFAPCLNSFDEFNSARHDENSLQSYYIGWVFDDYAIIVTAYDGIFYDENTFEISFIEYMPIEWWNYLQDNSEDMSFKENVIEKLAQSNGVTLANTPATKTDVVTSVGIDPDKFEIPSSEKYKHDLSMMNLESDSDYPDTITVSYNDFSIDITSSTTPELVRTAMDEEPQEDSNNINQYLSYGDLSGWWDAVDFSWYNGDEEHLHDSTIRFTSKYYTVSMMGVTKDSTPYDIAAIFGTPNVSDVTYAGGGNYDEVQTLYWDDIEIAGQAIYSLVVEYYNGELYSMTVSFD